MNPRAVLYAPVPPTIATLLDGFAMSIGPCAWIWPLRVNVVPWHCAEVPATMTHAACAVPTGRPFAVTSAVKVIVLPGEIGPVGTFIDVMVWTTVKVVGLSAVLTAALPV